MNPIDHNTANQIRDAIKGLVSAFTANTAAQTAQTAVLTRQAEAEERLADNNAPSAADTPRVTYGLGSGAELDLTTSWQKLPIAGNVASTVQQGVPVAQLSPNGEIRNTSGRSFLIRLDCHVTASTPTEETDSAALTALGIGAILSPLLGVALARRKRVMGYGMSHPIIQLAVDIDGDINEVGPDQRSVGWGSENRIVYTIPAYSGATWIANDGALAARIKPCPSYAEAGTPSVRLIPRFLNLFSIESFTAAATGS